MNLSLLNLLTFSSDALRTLPEMNLTNSSFGRNRNSSLLTTSLKIIIINLYMLYDLVTKLDKVIKFIIQELFSNVFFRTC